MNMFNLFNGLCGVYVLMIKSLYEKLKEKKGLSNEFFLVFKSSWLEV